MRNRLLLAFLLIPGITFAATSNRHQALVKTAPPPDGGIHRITVPLSFEQHRPYAELTLTGPSGKPVRARFWLDTGGGAIVLSGPLATRLGLKPTGKAFKAEGNPIAATTAPGVRLGGMSLQLRDANAFLVLNKERTLEGTGAQGAFPLRALRNYQIVLDYPHARLTVAEPGTLKPEGQRLKAHFSDAGFIAVTATVNGHPYGFLLDTGGQYCMISQVELAQWMKQNPRWPHVTGAYGPANMMLGPSEASLDMLRIGSMQLGPFVLNDVGSVSRPKGNYERMMSRLTGRSVIGSIGGNVLRHFKVDIDYPHERLYLNRLASSGEKPLDMVGITLEPANGGYVIAGAMKEETGLRTGDRLLRVDGVSVSGRTIAEIMSSLSGPLGSARVLTIQRSGKLHRIKAKIIRIL